MSDTNCITKGDWGASCSSCGVPDCSTRPRLKTTTWSAMSKASSCNEEKRQSKMPWLEVENQVCASARCKGLPAGCDSLNPKP